MPPPPGLTKADVSNFIELYGNEEGGQARFAVYVGKPGPKVGHGALTLATSPTLILTLTQTWWPRPSSAIPIPSPHPHPSPQPGVVPGQ